MNYYLVIAKCGHVGKGRYVEVEFPVYAEDKKSAAQMVLKRGKVKKQLKNAITTVYEISYNEYIVKSNEFDDNTFVRAHTKKEILDYIESAEQLISLKKHYKKSFNSREERIMFLFKKNKIMEDLIYA
ncbi:MAG: hypothetical protein E7176_06625 [Erysipelotrichaceae bacterium]|nr:hypothetical protein [Erysipelotrichaceae bacterium]